MEKAFFSVVFIFVDNFFFLRYNEEDEIKFTSLKKERRLYEP